ncbi:MAG: Eco57I restriction-modification methylase domain-containing protein [Nitrospinae bacterium]|nr:Eco57I restriction-modification methylase domain-containing protein [Nitrospinota bacterium]
MSKEQIQSALQRFAQGNLSENALNLFKTLGYNTERQAPLDKPTYSAFKESFVDAQSKFNEDKALVKDWETVDLLFQLSKEEVLKQTDLFDTRRVDNAVIESYLFFAIELAKPQYTRAELCHITREVNRLFRMPVMLLFKHGESLTLSVINRRLHKRDENRDVLKKVTLIKDIRTEKPHRAHIDIFFDLSFDELKRKVGFSNFVELHHAWQKTLDTKELNKSFYQKLFYWYLWAVKDVKFPQIRPKEDLIPDEAHQSESVIRLLTRLLFCWFMKEKQELIPEILFNQNKVREMLKNFSTDRKKSSVYYRAILQNLFFATLSVPVKNRKYIRESYQGKNEDYGNPYVFRYQDEFLDPKENLKLFKDIPFLNGGLFECLDERPNGDGEMEIRLDGFSTNEKKQAFVPDYLFWGEHHGINLAKELDSNKKNQETVVGIIDILNSYKFTIDENTPLEEEIALDPELLGKVFESLLAYYNPETKANARKQTGSFYTPREIVNYMVDESLIATFKQKLHDAGILENVEERLRDLAGYNENENPFTPKETDVIIRALEDLKILDPACGSGAFPMGILHKLVWMLRKIDPDNEKWFESIINRLPEYTRAEMRKKLEGENWDYLRKLGIIQEAIYGIDIQPIAIQIAKLRFFISLLVDQDIRGNASDNFGLHPLPNLDFKLVAANTLIGAPEQSQPTEGQLFFGREEFFEQFTALTAAYFVSSLPAEKKDVTKKMRKLVDGKVREKLNQIQNLVKHVDERFSKHLAERNKAAIKQKQRDADLWKSYANLFKHESVGFFDIRYFFPEVKEGFDIVIGNPPYVRHESIKDLKPQLAKEFGSFYCGTADLYTYFYKKGLDILNGYGHLCFIAPNKFMRAGYGKNTRELLANKAVPRLVIDFGDLPIFDATTYPSILLLGKNAGAETEFLAATFTQTEQLEKMEETLTGIGFSMPVSSLKPEGWNLERPEVHSLMEKLRAKGKPLGEYVEGKFYYGIKTGLNEAFVIDAAARERLIAEDPKSAELIKPWLRGRDIKKWKAEWAGLYVINIASSANREWPWSNEKTEAKARPIFEKAYPSIHKHL